MVSVVSLSRLFFFLILRKDKNKKKMKPFEIDASEAYFRRICKHLRDMGL